MEVLISSLQHLSLVGRGPLHFLAHRQRPFELHTLANQFSATKFTIGISSFESTGFALLEASRFVTVTIMAEAEKILRCGGVYKIQTCVVKLYKGPQKYCVNIYYFVTSK
jgi:hypothetical protein